MLLLICYAVNDLGFLLLLNFYNAFNRKLYITKNSEIYLSYNYSIVLYDNYVYYCVHSIYYNLYSQSF